MRFETVNRVVGAVYRSLEAFSPRVGHLFALLLPIVIFLLAIMVALFVIVMLCVAVHDFKAFAGLLGLLCQLALALVVEWAFLTGDTVIQQLRKRLSLGLEGLYGIKEARNGVDSGDHWRIQLGMVYSLFD